MRPSPRLLALALGSFAISVVALSLGPALQGVGLVVWGGLGALLLADLAISVRPRALSLDFEGPGQIFTGESKVFTVRIGIAARRLPRGLRCRIAYPAALAGPAEAHFEAAPDGAGAVARVEITPRRRGAWRLEHLWLFWRSRLGLLEFTPKCPLDVTIEVVPNIRPIQSGQIDVAVRSTLFGTKQNILSGEGSEFHQLREFSAGMDTHSIDWKRSARHRVLLAKEMRAERNHRVVLALDNGFLMREELDGLPKIDHAINAALIVAWAAVIGGDLVGLFAFDSRPQLYLPPEPGRGAFARMRAQTATLEYRSVETNYTLAMAHLHGRLERRSLIVVFSDFVDTTSAELLVENVRVLSRRHVIIFVALRDPSLEAIAAAVPDSMTDVAKSVAAGQFLSERRMVMESLSRIGVFCVDAFPGMVSARLVSTYLSIKSREII